MAAANEEIDALHLHAALPHWQQWEQAERVIGTIADPNERIRALAELATALVRAQQWEQAEGGARTRAHVNARIRAVAEVATALVRAQQWEQARERWQQAL